MKKGMKNTTKLVVFIVIIGVILAFLLIIDRSVSLGPPIVSLSCKAKGENYFPCDSAVNCCGDQCINSLTQKCCMANVNGKIELYACKKAQECNLTSVSCGPATPPMPSKLMFESSIRPSQKCNFSAKCDDFVFLATNSTDAFIEANYFISKVNKSTCPRLESFSISSTKVLFNSGYKTSIHYCLR